MKRCPNCGERISEETKFCIYCGANIKEVEKTLREKANATSRAAAKPAATKTTTTKAATSAPKAAAPTTSEPSAAQPTEVNLTMFSLKKCKSCGAYVHGSRSTCPVCRKEVEGNPAAKKKTPSEMADDAVIARNEGWFKFYVNLPKVLAIISAVLVFIWSIVDVAVFNYRGYYGVMHLPSAFLAMFIWWSIGALNSWLTYVFTNLIVCYPVLQIYYLQKISKKTKDD